MVCLIGRQKLSVCEIAKQDLRLFNLRLGELPRIKHRKFAQPDDSQNDPTLVLTRPPPPEPDQPQRGVGPQYQHLLPPFVLKPKIWPCATTNCHIRSQASRQRLRVIRKSRLK